MPEYLKSNQQSTRLTRRVVPSNKTPSLNIGLRREYRNDRLSLRCTITNPTASLKNSFFIHTHILWNALPTEIKEIADKNIFNSRVQMLFWEIILNPD